MTKASRRLPAWLVWPMRIFGVLLILYCLWALFVIGVGFWLLAHTKDGLLAGSGMLLAEGLGRLVGTLVILWLGVWMLQLPKKTAPTAGAVAATVPEPEAARVVAPVVSLPASARNKNWQICNVLQAGNPGAALWQFDAQKFSLTREFRSPNGEPLPPNLAAKSWGALFQKKLNVAWLPADHVFLRVAQFPMSTPEETRAMVDLQLEKLSPIPVTQALWTMHVLPKTASDGPGENLQTIVVVVVARDVVEEFLGKLEGRGYMADRIELPMLDQLQATRVSGDGAWIYPETHGAGGQALVAWWYGGVLQNLALLTLDVGPNRIASLKDQLVQMTWAGELEGWLASSPHWHLVGEATDPWYAVLREALEQPVEVASAVPATELAAMTARRAARSETNNSLLPVEFATRYHQRFVDRLWGRGLLAALAIYAVCLAIYFVALTVFSTLTGRVETQAAELSQSYTNSIQLKEMLGVLKQRETLKFAALDCWEAVAENMPAGLTLETLNFNDGKTLSLRGTAPTEQATAVTDFYDSLRKWKKGTQPLFDANSGEPPNIHGGNVGVVSWSFDLELKESGKQ